MISMKDVAREAGVSVNAVSLALRGDRSIPAPTRERIRRAAETVGYRRNPLVSALMAARGGRRGRSASGRIPLVFLTFNRTADDWRRHDAVRRYYEGALRRANDLGYALEPFWMADPARSAARAGTILHARGVQGLLFAPTPDVAVYTDLDVSDFACVTLDPGGAIPALHRVAPDIRHAVADALRHLREAGFLRPGLVVRRYADERADLEWTSSFASWRPYLGFAEGPPPLILEHRDPAASENRRDFRAWLRRGHPDVVLALDAVVAQWLSELSPPGVPRPAVAFLERTGQTPGAMGIDRDSERIGAAAVDLLVSLLHRNERGIPSSGDTLLVKGRWIPTREAAAEKDRPRGREAPD